MTTTFTGTATSKREVIPEPKLTRGQQLAALARSKESFIYWLSWVKIQTEWGADWFKLYDYQRYVAEEWEKAYWSDNQEGFLELKGRQLGFSWLIAAFAYWCAGYHQSSDVGMWSMGDREVKEQIRRMQRIHRWLPDWLRPAADVKQGELIFEQASMIKSFPATKLSGESFTFRVVLMDEWSKHAYGDENWGAVAPTIQENGMYVLFSTSNPELGPSGAFYELYKDSGGLQVHELDVPGVYEADVQKTPGLTCRFTSWWVRPPRYVEENGKKKPNTDWLKRATQRIKGTPEAIASYYPNNPMEAFMGKKGQVFPDGAPIGRAKVGWEDFTWRIAGVDWGGGDPTSVVLIGITRDQHFYQIGEYYRETPVGLQEIYAYLARAHDKAPFDFVICGRENRTSITSLTGLGLPAYGFGDGLGKGSGGRESSLDIMRMLHSEKRVFIDPDCTASIAEYPGYRHIEQIDPFDKKRYGTARTTHAHSHTHDARRYAIVTAWHLLPQRELTDPREVDRRRGAVFV